MKILKWLGAVVALLLLPPVLAVAGLLLGVFLWFQVIRLIILLKSGDADAITKDKGTDKG